jgi:hypothetical protein
MTNKLTASNKLQDLLYRDLKLGDMFRFVYEKNLKSTYMKIYPGQDQWRFIDLATGGTWGGSDMITNVLMNSPLERIPFLIIEAQGETQ